MTYQEVNNLISEIATALKCEYAYSTFKDGKRDRFIIFFYDGSDDLFADNENYQSIENLRIDFYSATKEIDSEQTIQSILKAHELGYDKNTSYISSEQIHMTTYNTEVLIKWETKLSSV